jgi:hypothetical protein
MALADIQREIQAIQAAYDGEDVRGSLVSALTAMNNNTNGICEQAVTDAQTAASDAQSSAMTASTNATQAAMSASTATSAANSASADAARAEAAAGQAVQGGVRSFNGRSPDAQTGNIEPQAGDYSSDLIGYNNSTVEASLNSINTKLSNLTNLFNPITAQPEKNVSVPANGYVDISFDVYISGRWTALGLVGFSNQRPGIYQYKCIIPSNGVVIPSSESGKSKATIQLGLRNTTSESISIRPGIRVLWMKV